MPKHGKKGTGFPPGPKAPVSKSGASKPKDVTAKYAHKTKKGPK